MLFCKEFHSLAESILTSYFPASNIESGEFSERARGLNVLPPLMQGLSMGGRDLYKNLLLQSSDPEIRSWPDERKRQLAAKAQKTHKSKRMTCHPDIRGQHNQYKPGCLPVYVATSAQQQLRTQTTPFCNLFSR
jgi:hypothetical protein